MDANQEILYKYLTRLTTKVSREASDKQDNVAIKLIARDEKISELTQQLNETNQIVSDLMIKSRQQSPVSLDNSFENTSTQKIEKSNKIHLSVKVDDPEKYFNNPDKDTLEFDAWRLGIEARLRDNEGWFSTEEQKINYVMRRLAGNASKDAIPFLKSTNPDKFKDVYEMLDHLEANYGDPDRKRKAEIEWDNLRLVFPETYGSKNDKISYVRFRNCFTRLAAKLKRPRYEWKDAFERHVSPTLSKALALQFLDDSIDFATVAQLAQKVDYTNSVADAAIKAKRDAEKNSNTRQNISRVGMPDLGKEVGFKNKKNHESKNNNVKTSAPSKDQFEKALKGNLCWICMKPDHKSYDCPRNKSMEYNKQNRESRINNFYERMFSDVSASERLESNAENLDECNSSEN